MELWMRRISVVLITIMTLGMYIPPTHLEVDAEESNETVSQKAEVTEDVLIEAEEEAETTLSPDEIGSNEELSNDHLINVITEKAKEQTITKLGSKIAKQVEDDFKAEILPKMEEALQLLLIEEGEEELAYYGITEQPAQGSGEKIFNVYNYRTKKDVAKFHVRRDNRPLEGYWFNFHYHVSKDGFEDHHEIGEIYWDKNVPPKWMS